MSDDSTASVRRSDDELNRRLGSTAFELLTVTDVCHLLNVSRWQVYRLINARELASVKIGRRRLVPRVDLDSFVETLRRRSETA